MPGLSINVSVDEPNTRLTKDEIAIFVNELEDETDRDRINATLERIINAQKNPYQLRELNDLRKILYNSKFKLSEIVSSIQGALMRMTPTGGKHMTPTGGVKRRTRRSTQKRKSKTMRKRR